MNRTTASSFLFLISSNTSRAPLATSQARKFGVIATVLTGAHLFAAYDYFIRIPKERNSQFSQWKQFQYESKVYIRDRDKIGLILKQKSDELRQQRLNYPMKDLNFWIRLSLTIVPSLFLSPFVHMMQRKEARKQMLVADCADPNRFCTKNNMSLPKLLAETCTGAPTLIWDNIRSRNWYLNTYASDGEKALQHLRETESEASAVYHLQQALIRMNDPALFDPLTIQKCLRSHNQKGPKTIIGPAYMFSANSLSSLNLLLSAIFRAHFIYRANRGSSQYVDPEVKQKNIDEVLYLFEFALERERENPLGIENEIRENMLEFTNFFS